MEGLEISIIDYSIYSNTYRNRLDSEYYIKDFLDNESYLKGSAIINYIKKEKIRNIKSISLTKSFNYVSISSINLSSLEYLTTSLNHNEIPDRATYILKNNDIIVSTVRPNRNAVALILNPTRLVGTSGFTVLRADEDKINPYFLFAFCKTKFFVTKLMRENTATMYPAVTDYDILNIRIPSLSVNFQKEIEKIILNSGLLITQSKQLYTQAEQILLEEIGLQNFDYNNSPPLEGCPQDGVVSVNIKSFKDSFGTSGRLDAEYYQKKYERIIDKVKSQSYDILSNLVKIKKSIEPGSKNYTEKGLSFMRVADLSKNGLSEPQKYISDGFVKENQDKIDDLKPKKGTILFSKDGSVGIAYHLRKDYEGITSGAILHLKVKDEKAIIPEYLTLALNSKVVQMQAERDAGGSIILHWRSSEIANVVVPIITFDKQKQIADLIEQSFALKKQSEDLLEVAKQAVEIAIEEDETTALRYIKQ